MSTTTQATPLSGTYVADEIHSSFDFAVRYMGVTTYKSSFNDVSASLTAGADGVTLEGTAQVESIGIVKPAEFRGHVLSDDFFAAETHPQISFRSNQVEFGADGTVTIAGDLTIKGITKPVTATGSYQGDTQDAFGGTKASIAVEATVNRRDFGMNWDAPLPNGGSALADDVTISVNLVLVKQ